MAFEKYVKSGRTYKPMVSLWSRGQIGFNHGAVQRFKDITNHKFAVLYFDEDTQRIGIKLTDNENDDGITSIIKGKTGVIISAASFLDNFKIDHTTTRKYPVEFDADEQMYIIDLNRPMAKKERQ